MLWNGYAKLCYGMAMLSYAMDMLSYAKQLNGYAKLCYAMAMLILQSSLPPSPVLNHPSSLDSSLPVLP